jgi:hypothetical protein
MSANKRPSTSSLRRFITSRPYVSVAEIRRRFGLDDPDAMAHVHRNGTSAWIGLPEREATKLQELWHRDELGLQMSVEVRAPVVVGVYPMRIARYVTDGLAAVGAAPINGQAHPGGAVRPYLNGDRAILPPAGPEPAFSPDASHIEGDASSDTQAALPPAE